MLNINHMALYYFDNNKIILLTSYNNDELFELIEQIEFSLNDPVD